MTSSTSTTTTTRTGCHDNNTSSHHNHTRQHDLKPVLKSSIYVRRRREGLIGATDTTFGEYDDGEQRIPSFSSIASTSSSTSSILPPPTPTSSTSVRFSPESTKIQYFIPESPVQEFLDKNNYSSFTSSYYDINSNDTIKADSWNPYWSYESDDEDNIYSYEDDDDQEDDDLWELMVGVTSRIKDWFMPPRRKSATRNSSNSSATANTSTISSNYINTSGGLLDLVFTLISVAKSVASLMATWVVYQGLVRVLWIVRRPAIRHHQPQQHYFQLKQYNNNIKKGTNNKRLISSSSSSSSSLLSSSSYSKT